MKSDRTKGERTRSKIIGAAKMLFGTYSYDYVSTRMIAREAKCSQSAVAFYFGTKENLCANVIQDILKYHKTFYEPIKNAVEASEQRGEMTRETALGFLQQYIHTQINIAFDTRNRCAISFSVNGSTLPEGVADPLNESITNNVALPMARLLNCYAKLPLFRALVYSQALTDVIVCYQFTGQSMMPLYRTMKEAKSLYEAEGDESILNEVKQYIMDFCMQSIRSLRNPQL